MNETGFRFDFAYFYKSEIILKAGFVAIVSAYS